MLILNREKKARLALGEVREAIHKTDKPVERGALAREARRCRETIAREVNR